MPKLNSGPETIGESKSAFAARVGLTRGRISQLIAEGLPVRAEGRIDVDVGLAWIENNLDLARRNKGRWCQRYGQIGHPRRGPPPARDRQGPARQARLRARERHPDRRRCSRTHRLCPRQGRARRPPRLGTAFRSHHRRPARRRDRTRLRRPRPADARASGASCLDAASGIDRCVSASRKPRIGRALCRRSTYRKFAKG